MTVEIEVFIENGKTYAKITDLKVWDKNPRNINKDDFERLKRQLLKFGQYKPLIIINDGTVIGGNMRLRGYTALLEEYRNLGIVGLIEKYNKNAKTKILQHEAQKTIDQIEKGIWVSIVEPKDEQEKVEYALSDNDRAGYYHVESLTELLSPLEGLDASDYSADFYEPVLVEKVMDDFTHNEPPKPRDPDAPEGSAADDNHGKKTGVEVECPHCGEKFILGKRNDETAKTTN